MGAFGAPCLQQWASEQIYYGMPVRHMLYDAVDHTKQMLDLLHNMRDFLDVPLIKDNADAIRTEEGGMNMCTAFQQMRREGEQQGKKMGEEKLSRLMQFLIHDNRIEDLLKASLDAGYAAL